MNVSEILTPSNLSLWVIIPAMIGNVLWVIMYILIIVKARQHQFVEMPIFVITGNLVWEGLYGFVLPWNNNLNPILHWQINIWCLTDCIILFLAIKYASISISTPLVLKHIKSISGGLIIFWAIFIYAIAISDIKSENAISANQDLIREAISAYILNILISTTYIFQYLRFYNHRKFIPAIAWLKMIGTGLNTFAVYVNKPFNLLIFVMGIIVLLADIIYILLLKILPNNITSIRLSQEVDKPKVSVDSGLIPHNTKLS
ncbi:MAG: hypothetical protein MUF71_18970 [Candidatus Kapabacteria bacterium]|jgi:hypothetical protein|nr:hypothetical protein [Candidatus Kapabacteria bacterium]